MLIFSFCARAGRLLLLDVFLLNIVLASHVLGMSLMCVLKKTVLRGRPSTDRDRRSDAVSWGCLFTIQSRLEKESLIQRPTKCMRAPTQLRVYTHLP